MRTTYMAKPADIEKKWYVVDATDKTLGRLASEVAKVLRGKNKAIFTPTIDTGDYVIVINADKIKVTCSLRLLKKFTPPMQIVSYPLLAQSMVMQLRNLKFLKSNFNRC